jgi:hypothetical protein
VAAGEASGVVEAVGADSRPHCSKQIQEHQYDFNFRE